MLDKSCGECGWYRPQLELCTCPCIQTTSAVIVFLEQYPADAVCDCSHFVPTLLYLANLPDPVPDDICSNCEHWAVSLPDTRDVDAHTDFTMLFKCKSYRSYPRTAKTTDDDWAPLYHPYAPCDCNDFTPRRGYIDVTARDRT